MKLPSPPDALYMFCVCALPHCETVFAKRFIARVAAVEVHPTTMHVTTQAPTQLCLSHVSECARAKTAADRGNSMGARHMRRHSRAPTSREASNDGSHVRTCTAHGWEEVMICGASLRIGARTGTFALEQLSHSCPTS